MHEFLLFLSIFCTIFLLFSTSSFSFFCLNFLHDFFVFLDQGFARLGFYLHHFLHDVFPFLHQFFIRFFFDFLQKIFCTNVLLFRINLCRNCFSKTRTLRTQPISNRTKLCFSSRTGQINLSETTSRS